MVKVCQHENKEVSTSFAIGDLTELVVSKYYDCKACGGVVVEQESVNLGDLMNLIKGERKIEVKVLDKA